MANEIGSLILDLEGKEMTAEERDILAHPLVGGVILFTRNYASRAQLQDLCRQMRAVRRDPLLIMVDQEGGRVQRFIPEFTRLPPMGLFGQIYDKNESDGVSLAKDCGWLMAVELLSLGVNLSLAPVLDLNKGNNSVIADRAYHANADKVITLAKAYIQGMQEAGMAPTGKHFPGHGTVSADSHVAHPIDTRSLDEIERDDLIPFIAFIKAGLPAMMAAHIVFPKVDALPVGYSRIWLNGILRTRFGFTGTILSDDLNMEGANISANYADRVLAAREAGCDFALLCNNRKGVIETLDYLPLQKHKVAENKWRVLHGKPSFNPDYQQLTRFQEIQQWLSNYR